MNKVSIFVLAAAVLAVPAAASAQEAYTTRSVNVRGGPDTTYPPVAVLAPGAPVQVQGCLEDWSWCDVVFANDRGWVYAPYLNYVYQGARVPFYSYAPTFGIPIVVFSVGSYWDRYYRGRSFYGRRDYWVQRAPPQHYRPAGPPPRAYHERFDSRPQDRHNSGSQGYNNYRGTNNDNRYNNNRNNDNRNNDNRNNDNRNSDNRNNDNRFNRAPNAPVENRSGAPSRNVHTPTGNAAVPAPPQGSQEMRRASPNAPAGPPAGVRGAAPENHEGNKGRGSDHQGGKDEKQR